MRPLPVRRLVVVALAVLLAGGVAACTGSGNADDRAIPTTSKAPTSAPPATRALPVYYAADTSAGVRLHREFHAVTLDDPGTAAVREMLGTPPIDGDYRTLWPTGVTPRGPVTRDGGEIVVDLTGIGRAPGSKQAATLALQQLVYTVQGALQSTDPVRVLVYGQRADRLWGLADIGAPLGRGDQTAVRSLVQIDSPADGATVGREVVVTGEAAVFEATLPWEVRQGERVVTSGFATTAEGQKFSPYRFGVTLEPGDYVLVVTEDDPSGGAGRAPMTDTKRISVR
ncbi:Gmad2 immunoglobulin-like domain-containing protein [Pseudonocardia sp. N23]|uniref:Gmad2 immunoglobulin-like domain-containing protein n=1 Tax=Pseudonocardia sp. N23 TaxID=1987376 RepID=UPI0015584759|nr:Gmad2 immunoglobulin-like domain-containing protein [Pseudonocardia sp. N23]